MKKTESELMSILEERYDQFQKEDLRIFENLPIDKRTKLNDIMNRGEFLQIEFNKAYFEKDEKMIEVLSKINLQLGKELDEIFGY